MRRLGKRCTKSIRTDVLKWLHRDIGCVMIRKEQNKCSFLIFCYGDEENARTCAGAFDDR